MHDPSARPKRELTDESPVRMIADHLHSAAVHLLRRVRETDEEFGLSAARLSTLSYLVFAGPASVGELARAEQVSPANISQLVNGMVRDGLVERVADPGDGRVTLVVPTEAGGEIMREGRRARVDNLTKLLRRFGQSELQALEDASQLIHKALEG